MRKLKQLGPVIPALILIALAIYFLSEAQLSTEYTDGANITYAENPAFMLLGFICFIVGMLALSAMPIYLNKVKK